MKKNTVIDAIILPLVYTIIGFDISRDIGVVKICKFGGAMCLKLFVNDRYKVMDLLYDHKIKIKDDCYTTLSQQEIANLVNFSKQKTNKIINELIDEGYIEVYKNLRGKYIITESGIKIIQLVRTTDV